MKRKLFFVPMLLALTLAAACTESATSPVAPPVVPPPADPVASGAWAGTVQGMTVTLTLAESNNTIAGSGNISAPGSSLALTATGTRAHPSVALTLRASGFEDMNFQGNFSGNNMIVGTLNGSGFSNEGLTLRRQ
jgi:hypothetical protein